MTVEKQKIRPEFRIYIPSKTKTGGPIPSDILQSFYDTIRERVSRQNIGCNFIENKGSYLSGTGEITDDPNIIAEFTGVLPFSDEKLTLWAIKLDQECIRVEKRGLVEAYHHNGKIEPDYEYKIKFNTDSIGYCIEMNPEQFICGDDDSEVEVLDIPEKYVISCFSYDEIGQPMAAELLSENAISQIMSKSDTNTYLLLEGLLKQLDILNSR